MSLNLKLTWLFELMIRNSSRVGSLLCGFGPTQFKRKLIPYVITAKITGF